MSLGGKGKNRPTVHPTVREIRDTTMTDQLRSSEKGAKSPATSSAIGPEILNAQAALLT